MQDRQGRPYVKLSDLREGDTVWLDDDFSCCEATPVQVRVQDNSKPYFECEHGQHFFDGQIEQEDYLVGVYPKDPCLHSIA